jgi:endonuclease/exonuclease/phosphatase family metal-dependent hydrolase
MSSTVKIAYGALIASIAALTMIPAGGAAASQRPRVPTFKVATWNIRSGMGIHRSEAAWDSTTLNCTDASKPMNAWGVGIPQRELERIKADTTIVAFAVQEAWNCAKPARINEVLEFAAITREQEGVALAARYGFAGEPIYHRIDPVTNRWLIGGRVCLDGGCSRAVPMFSTHLGGKTDADYAVEARTIVEFLKTQPPAHLFMGDLNIFQVDRWNPRVRCTSDDAPGRSDAIALIAAAGYVDAWKATQTGEGWTGMNSRKGCGSPEGNLYKRIDYVHLAGLRPVSTTRFARPAPGVHVDAPSDHVGLIAEVEIPGVQTD